MVVIIKIGGVDYFSDDLCLIVDVLCGVCVQCVVGEQVVEIECCLLVSQECLQFQLIFLVDINIEIVYWDNFCKIKIIGKCFNYVVGFCYGWC